MLEVLRSGRLSLGPTIDRFEEMLAAKRRRAVRAAVSSGTAGLHLCCASRRGWPGDEVITSPYSFVASANCAIYEGATPVFADIDPRTLNLDPAAVEAAVTPRTKAIVAVDIFGYPCELDELRAICERHGLALVEDSCEALGAALQGATARLARPPARSGPSTRTSRSRPARAGGDHRLRGGVASCCARSATRAAARRRAGSARPARLQLPARRHLAPRSAIGQLERLDRDPRRAATPSRRATGSCLPTSPMSSCRSPTTPTTGGSWFVYVVDAARRRRPRRA